MSFSFENLKLSKDLIRDAKGQCPKCRKKIWFYCSTCLILSDAVTPNSIPYVSLPYTLHIVRDVREAATKSSAIPLSVLTDAVFYDCQDLKIDADPLNALLLFPSNDAKSTADVHWNQVKDVYVIDATWTQAQALMRSGVFAGIPTVKLNAYTTQFWRYNNGHYVDKHNLSTVEAIYYLAKEGRVADPERFALTNPDDLLYAYALQFSKIRASRSTEGQALIDGAQVGERARARRILSRGKRKEVPEIRELQ